MNKFRGPKDPNYELVSGRIRELVEKFPSLIEERKRHRNGENSYSVEASPLILPFERNEQMVVRKDIFEALYRMLSLTQRRQSVALWGLGGSGKTQVALEYAYHRRELTGCSVFWVNCDDKSRFLEVYRKISTAANISADLKGSELLTTVRCWLETQTTWLLVLDNADALDLFKARRDAASPEDDTKFNELHEFIPRGENGTILWTSRDANIVGSIVGAQRGIEVRKMDADESAALLHSLCKVDAAPEVQDLLNVLEHLPLAIAQAAAYIRERGISIQDYLQKLDSEERRFKVLATEFVDRHRDSQVPNSVLHTWKISTDYISQESKCARAMMYTLGFLDNVGIPIQLLEAVGDQYDEEEVLHAIGRLRAFSFLRLEHMENPGFTTYSMHRLVHLSIQYFILSTVDDIISQSYKSKALYSMSLLYPTGTYGTWFWCQIYLPHALNICSIPCSKTDNGLIVELQIKIARYLWEQGRSKEAEEIEVRVLELQKEMSGETHPDTLDSIASLAATYWQQGRLKEAEEIEVRVVELRKEVLGETHPDTLDSMVSLAATYHQQGRSKEAEEIEVRVLELRKEVLGETHPNTLYSMASLAATYWQQGRSKEAEEINVRVLELRKEVLGETHPDTLDSMASLAATYWQQGRLKEAEEIEVQVLELRKEVLGETHPDTLDSMASLAATYWQQGRSKEAEEINVRVLELRKQLLGETHPECAP